MSSLVIETTVAGKVAALTAGLVSIGPLYQVNETNDPLWSEGKLFGGGAWGVEDNTAITYSVQIHVTSSSVEEQHLKGDQRGHLIQANAPSLTPLGMARLLGACHSLHLNNAIVPIETHTQTHTHRHMHLLKGRCITPSETLARDPSFCLLQASYTIPYTWYSTHAVIGNRKRYKIQLFDMLMGQADVGSLPVH